MEEYKCRDGADHLAAGPGPGQGKLARFRGGKKEVRRKFQLLVVSPNGISQKEMSGLCP